MNFTTFLFYAFATILVLASLRVITARNPVHAALFLVLAFFQAAGIWMLLKAEFLSIVLVLVYVGAVMVLFLFVVMMIDIDLDKLRAGFWNYLPVASIVGGVIVLEMAAVIWRAFPSNGGAVVPEAANTIGQTKALGLLIYTEYILAFEIAAVVLLVAIVAAVALTLRKRKDTKHFDPADAVRVKRNDRLKIVKMDATVHAPVAPVETKEAP
ncbi:NADH-quinone oxidoreductase subunit J [Pseudoduganella sp. DS3]|uniref:NADH-quinone oxidoreductase subunit J n=1 Tax=Pseudoduganella guangdongensis TaxID=2692179 RepID=A0A6N9HH74_9BURK|nr:NADH-quinone oxidoreductase subunit J [Pseudoduganella guangdongensis]MYN02958.1 NADH-quinone oxidoreductase subunit J [Pseudoduganella guangdongensis]